MDNKCPKCGKKLGVLYMKETCPGCGCNLMRYNMESRLEEDNKKAEAEYARFERFVSVFKRKKK